MIKIEMAIKAIIPQTRHKTHKYFWNSFMSFCSSTKSFKKKITKIKNQEIILHPSSNKTQREWGLASYLFLNEIHLFSLFPEFFHKLLLLLSNLKK